IPDVIGQSEHAADINITRHGMEVGSLATTHLSGAAPETVVAQSPRANAKDAASPRISLLLSAADNAPAYVMPNFVGKSLAQTAKTVESAGFTVGRVWRIPAPSTDEGESGSEIILKQSPPAGQKVTAGTAINFEVRE